MQPERPKFLPSYIALIGKETERRGVLALIPYKLILIMGIGAGVAFFVPNSFWAQAKWDVATTVFGGLLTFNGLVLALGWTAFSKIYDILFRREFATFLAKHDQLNSYLIHINYMHYAQVFAVLLSGAALLMVLFTGIPISWERVMLAVTVGATIYAIQQAMDAVTAMNDLIWQAAYFESHLPARNKGNVTPLDRSGNS